MQQTMSPSYCLNSQTSLVRVKGKAADVVDLADVVCYTPGHLAHIFFLFLSDMYLYDHLILTHMTAYLYNRAIASGTPLFPPFVCFLLFPSYGSLL